MIFKNLKNDTGFYIPMYNKLGFKSYVTPRLLGDIKLDYHTYLLEPTTEIDLTSSFFSRHVSFYVDGKPHFLNGNSESQQTDKIDVELGLLYQKVTRHNKKFQLDVTTFVPLDALMESNVITYQNTTSKTQRLKVIVATPLYGRSADNLRDHRHVTSLLNRVEVLENCVVLNPTLSFDERGHKKNELNYGVFASSPQLSVEGYYPSLEDYVKNGSLQFPKGLDCLVQTGDYVEGKEALGGISFKTIEVKSQEVITLYFNLGINHSKEQLISTFNKYSQSKTIAIAFEEVKTYFTKEVSKLQFHMKNLEYSEKLNYIPIQPILRRFQGNSYLPHHDYGKGGRGWRDLWQDLISMIMYNDSECRSLLLNNFAGVRIDGSNATIIGDKAGEFLADRNNIVRVWSDHAAWPLLTTKMYIDEIGDLSFLLETQTYFDDQFTHYTKKTKTKQSTNHQLKIQNDTIYGTVLEHLILQNVVAINNVGSNGFVRLEDADWNDGLDMASKKGETIAFTHFYINNLLVLAELIQKLETPKIELFESLTKLILNKNYSLDMFFDDVHDFTDNKVSIDKEILASELTKKATLVLKQINKYAFMPEGGLQSYIDNDGNFLDSSSTLSLTGQTMALLNQTLSKTQAKKVSNVTKKHLFDRMIGGYRLNSNYQDVKMNMGRAYGFAYGTKENGAVFSHMSLMYAYGLYQYNFIKQGREAYQTLVNQAFKDKSVVCLGIPEYFNNEGIGKYLYLTGSATWLLKLLRTEVFGIELSFGTLRLNPKLSKDDFIDSIAVIKTYVHNKPLQVTYHNPKKLEYGDYRIASIQMNGKEVINEFQSIEGDLEVYLDDIV
nr:hypothetical protein [Paracholeplasma sp.]